MYKQNIVLCILNYIVSIWVTPRTSKNQVTPRTAKNIYKKRKN